MGNSKSAFSRDLMESENLEDLIAELKTIRDRESEILVEIEGIIRDNIEASPRAQTARRTSAPTSVGPRAPARVRRSGNRAFSLGKGNTNKAPQVLATINGIARGDRVFLRTKVTKPADWPDNRKFDPEASRYAVVTCIAPTKISVLTDTKIETWRAPHNVQRIVE
jgi:hypothetical protein